MIHEAFRVFNATFDPVEERWKAGQFMNLKADAPFFEAAFNARLADKLLAEGYGIRRTERETRLKANPETLGRRAPDELQHVGVLATATNRFPEYHAPCPGLKTYLVASSLRSKINAEVKDPVVLVLWMSVADGKLVARSHGPR
jgi:hypothetical protein